MIILFYILIYIRMELFYPLKTPVSGSDRLDPSTPPTSSPLSTCWKSLSEVKYANDIKGNE